MSKKDSRLLRIIRPFETVFSGAVWIDSSGNECFVRDDGSISCRTVNDEPTLTIQSEKDACDVNWIVAKFRKTGLMTNVRTEQPRYGDFSSAVDYHDSVLRAQNARDDFMSLPAAIRTRFNNDPGELIDFLNNEENRPEAIKLGLVTEPQATQVPQGDVTAPPDQGG